MSPSSKPVDRRSLLCVERQNLSFVPKLDCEWNPSPIDRAEDPSLRVASPILPLVPYPAEDGIIAEDILVSFGFPLRVMTFLCFDRDDVPHLHLSDVPPRVSRSNSLSSSSCDVRLPHRGVGVGWGQVSLRRSFQGGWMGCPWFRFLPRHTLLFHPIGLGSIVFHPTMRWERPPCTVALVLGAFLIRNVWWGIQVLPPFLLAVPSPLPPSCGSSSVPSGTRVDPMGSGLSRKNLQWIRSWERRTLSLDPTPARGEGRRKRGSERASNERAAAISNTCGKNNAKGNAAERK